MSFEAFIILSGGLKQNEDGSWRTTNLNELGDKSGVVGDRLRILAGAKLANKYSTAQIFVAGGKGYQTINHDAPKISDIMEQELIDQGVTPERIVKDGDTGSSYEQLQYLNSLVKDRDFKKIGLISNRYHLPRLKAMIEHLDSLSDFPNDRVEFLAAEDILIETDPNRWEQEIAAAYQTEEVKARIKLEERGIADLKNGKYYIK